MSAMSPPCGGTADNHCCWVDGVECPFVVKRGELVRCGLRERYGSWDAVHRSPEYLARIRPYWDRIGMEDCGDWPAPGRECGTCGVSGG